MRFRRSILFWCAFYSLGLFSVAMGEQVRESVIAGTWYDGDAAVLKRQINTFLDKAPSVADDGRLVALIAPPRRISVLGTGGGPRLQNFLRGAPSIRW